LSGIDREKILLGAGLVLATLLVAVVARGGGYGIGGLAWDDDLVVVRSTLRLGSVTVQPGDRVRAIFGREVHRDADLRGVLRSAEADELWVEVARDNHDVAVPLTPEVIEADDLPAVLRGPYQVVAIDGRHIEGALNLADMAFYMRANDEQPSVFTVRVPEFTFEGAATRVKRPEPILPIVLLMLALAALALAYLRGREEVMRGPRRLWQATGLSAATGGTLLAFLSWHEGFLADPVLLPFGLASLCLWRPLSLVAHGAQRRGPHEQASLYARLAVALPAAILLLASTYGWSRTLGLGGARLDGFVYDDLRHLVMVAVVASLLYHLADVAVHAAYLRTQPRLRVSVAALPWFAMLLALAFVVSALAALSTDAAAFAAGGYTAHFIGLVGIQVLGDLALIPKPAGDLRLLRDDSDANSIPEALAQAHHELRLPEPGIVCRMPGADVVLFWSDPADHAVRTEHADDDGLGEHASDGASAGSGSGGESGQPARRIVAAALDERLAGLIDLLDSEGGMFPRYKTFRGGDELEDDPFDGMDRVVGVSLVYPLDGASAEEPGETVLRAYLVNRIPEERDLVDLPPSAEELAAWSRAFNANPANWASLRSRAAEGALRLLAGGLPGGARRDPGTMATTAGAPQQGKPQQGAPPPAAEIPDATALAPNGASSSQASASATDETGATDHATPAATPAASASAGAVTSAPDLAQSVALGAREAAALHYTRRRLDAQYPVQELHLVAHLREALDGFASSRGPMLIQGPLGAGREHCARTIHMLSGLTGELVTFDCAQVPPTLVLAELVGEEACPGCLAAAESGTIVLRQVSSLDDALLVEVLAAVKAANARVIFIESADQDEEDSALPLPDRILRLVDEAVLELPELGEDPDALTAAAEYYLHRDAMLLGKVVTGFTPEVLEALPHRRWPANYYSLAAWVRDAVVRCHGDLLDAEAAQLTPGYSNLLDLIGAPGGQALSEQFEEFEREALANALRDAHGNKSQAARILGMKRTTFIRKLQKYNGE
jgi:hypothetical protein